MASKTAYRDADKGADIAELLDTLENQLDRCKVIYEQYFLGIQKMAPTQQHLEIERKVRDLTQMSIRNTALKYRFATLSQKFSSYNTYWKRTVRQIENGKYIRNLSRVSRQAARSGAEIPEEILAAMPKRMRDQVVRDRAAALAVDARRNAVNAMNAPATIEDAGMFGLPDAEPYDDDLEAWGEPNDTENLIGITELGRPLPASTQRPVDKKVRGAHQIDEAELGDFDLDAMFAALTQEAPTIIPPEVRARKAPSVPPPLPTPNAPPPFTASSARVRQASMPPPLPPPRSKTPTPLGDKTAMDIPSFTARTASDSWSKNPTPVIPRRIPSVDPSAMPPPSQRAGAFTRAPTTPRPIAPQPRRPSAPDMSPPAGMSEADVRSLYAKYSKAREMVGEKNDDATYQKLLRTIRAQAPKIMEQYKATGVEFGVVIKDNQVILKAKPKP